MPDVGDIIEITTISRIAPFADEFLNVFHYRVAQGEQFLFNDEMAGFANAYQDAVWTSVKAILSDAVSLVGLKAQNLEQMNDFGEYVYPIPIPGDVASDVLPPFVTWSFLLKRTTRLTRNGHKRFSGVPETWVNNGQPVSGHETAIADVNSVLEDSLLLDAFGGLSPQMIIDPVIIRKLSQFSYSFVNEVQSSQLTGLGTQNSRKYGRGS